MNRASKVFLLLLLTFSLCARSSAAGLNPDVKRKAKGAVDSGLHYLRAHQSPDGYWSKSVGITALALRAFLESHHHYKIHDDPMFSKAVHVLLANVRKDGSISESDQNSNYNTAVSIIALEDTGDPAYGKTIRNGRSYIKGLQLDGAKGFDTSHKYFGGIGYGDNERPDLSNEYMALEALKATSLNADDPVWKRAIMFVSRCQNRSESNDQAWAANDGGFTYSPGYSPYGGTASYGSMTNAGLVALLYAGLNRNDPRIQAAYNWIRRHYTLDTNPGARNSQALFYYYMAFAKSMYAYGDQWIVDGRGVRHNWRSELAAKLVALQNPDGSWVNQKSHRWWEGNKDLVTAFSVIALDLALR